MALTEASLLGNSQQAVASLFAPATNVLTNALTNAVDMGRRMVDLQSHQEDMFLSEREKLRLASERKGLEARRIFESDRKFGEDVLQDRRNFDEGVFRDRRNFGLESAYKMGSLGLQQQEFGLKQAESASRIDENTAHAEYLRAGGGRSAASNKGDLFGDLLIDATADGPVELGPPSNSMMTQFGWNPALQGVLNAGKVPGEAKIVDYLTKRGMTQRDADKSYMMAKTPEQKDAIRRIYGYLPSGDATPVSRVQQPFNSRTGTANNSSGFLPTSEQDDRQLDPITGEPIDEDLGVLPPLPSRYYPR
jgi:hypothetical protein